MASDSTTKEEGEDEQANTAGRRRGGAAGVLIAGGVAFATIPGADGTIWVCYGNNETLHVFDKEAGETCRGTELALLGASAKAADADKLGGLDSSAWGAVGAGNSISLQIRYDRIDAPNALQHPADGGAAESRSPSPAPSDAGVRTARGIAAATSTTTRPQCARTDPPRALTLPAAASNEIFHARDPCTVQLPRSTQSS